MMFLRRDYTGKPVKKSNYTMQMSPEDGKSVAWKAGECFK
jgi:hypothetical protein